LCFENILISYRHLKEIEKKNVFLLKILKLTLRSPCAQGQKDITD